MAAEPVACAQCGTEADPAPLTWSSAAGPDGVRQLCDLCTREHLRSIESRLDEQWWQPPRG